MLAPRLAAALRDTLSIDFAERSLALLDRSFVWGDEPPSKEALQNFVRDTLHIRRSIASPPPTTDAALLSKLVSGVTDTITVMVPRAKLGRRTVVLDGVRVRVPAIADTHQVGDGVRIQVPSLRPRLTPGYAHVVRDGPSASIAGATRVYLSADGTLQLIARWHATLSALSRTQIRYRAKVATSSAALPRSDAIVILSQDPRSVRAIIDAVGALAQHGWGTMRTSLFALEVAPGVAIGVEPRPSTDGSPVSFGESRSAPVAAWLHRGIADERPPDTRELSEYFTNCGIDPRETWAPLDRPAGSMVSKQPEKENCE